MDLLDNLVHPDDRNLWQDHSHLANTDGSPVPIEFRIVTKHGETRWMSHVCRPVYNEAGKFKGVCGSHRDITELKGGFSQNCGHTEQLRCMKLKEVCHYGKTIR